MTLHIFREELDADTHRELKIKFLERECQTAAYTICKKAELPIVFIAGSHFLNLDACWCPEPHHVDRSIYTADQLMRVMNDRVECQVHGTKWNVRQLLDILPLGKRKDRKKKDALLAKIAWNPRPERFYAFRGGEGVASMQSLNPDPVEALRAVHPSQKQKLAGVLIEAATLQRALEILEDDNIELPWHEGLEELLRHDMTLPAGWHGGSLSDKERLIAQDQQAEADREARKATMKLVAELKREADRLQP